MLLACQHISKHPYDIYQQKQLGVAQIRETLHFNHLIREQQN